MSALPVEALLLVAALVAIVLFAFRSTRTARTGVPTTATVVEVRDGFGWSGDRKNQIFVLDVVVPGQAALLRAEYRDAPSTQRLLAMQPGAQVPVRLDPKRPEKVAVDYGRM